MCIIIHRPAGAASRLSRETLQRCAVNNPDGFGMMWADKGKLHTARYLPSQRREFIKRALVLQALDIPLALHFRWATHGAISKENTHPFVLRKGHSALMHNGILSIPCVKGWSDTRSFAHNVVAGLPDGWEEDPTILWMMNQATDGSKVLIMYADGKVTILHKGRGVTEGGIWYSNDGFRPVAPGKTPSRGWENSEWSGWGQRHDGTWGPATSSKSAKDSAKTFEGKQSLPIKSSALYLFEGIVICGWCLARESNADDALLLDAKVGDKCELCYHSPFQPGSRTIIPKINIQKPKEPEQTALTLLSDPEDCVEEGRVCSGA